MTEFRARYPITGENGAVDRAAAYVDLEALARNIATLRSKAPGARFMAVVKADGYGHGLVDVARAARAAGVDYLGVALPSEARLLRESGDRGRILAWLYTPGADLRPCVSADVDLGVSSREMLGQVCDAAAAEGLRARVHLKLDTGLGRNGCTADQWPDLVARAGEARDRGLVEVIGIWSHLACGEVPDSPVTAAQLAVFDAGLGVAAELRVVPPLRHIANTGAVLAAPAARYDLVRCGIGIYGLSPGPDLGTSADLGLEPVMTVAARVALVKDVPAGSGVSYRHRYHTSAATRLALVPVGYGDGIPRIGSGQLPMAVAGARFRVAGTVAMDQVVLDIGDHPVRAGDLVRLFGAGVHGEPTADEWARVCGTINYEIVTRLGNRIPRIYRGGAG